MTRSRRGPNFSSTNDIQKKAKTEELREAGKWNISPDLLKLLDDLFDEVYNALQPSIADYQAREHIISYVQKFTHKSIRESYIMPYGSYTMELFTPESDLDLSLNVDYVGDMPKEMKVQILQEILPALRHFEESSLVHNVEDIFKAIVPILKFVDSTSGIECDISIENSDGIIKSQLIQIISKVDNRFRKLCYLMKFWAKAQNINSSKDRTLNSLSIILLVAFHLQTRSPPILPPFSVFLEDGGNHKEIERRVLRYQNFGIRNKETISELFTSFLYKMISVQPLWRKGLCASAYEGSWISKNFQNKVSWMAVEDLSIRSQNAARSVGRVECEVICDCMRNTLTYLQQCNPTSLELLNIKSFLFGSKPKPEYIHRQLPDVDKPSNLGKRKMPFDNIGSSKRLHHVEVESSNNIINRLPLVNSRVEGRGIDPNFETAGSSIPGRLIISMPRYAQPLSRPFPEHDPYLFPGASQFVIKHQSAMSNYQPNPGHSLRYNNGHNLMHEGMSIPFLNSQSNHNICTQTSALYEGLLSDQTHELAAAVPVQDWQTNTKGHPQMFVPFPDPRFDHRRHLVQSVPIQNWQRDLRRKAGLTVPPDFYLANSGHLGSSATFPKRQLDYWRCPKTFPYLRD